MGIEEIRGQTVWQRAQSVKQPRGGYVRPSQFKVIEYDDGITLYDWENIHPSVIGMVVDYLTRFSVCMEPVEEAFKISLFGAKRAEEYGDKGAYEYAKELSQMIFDLDDTSIIAACRLVSFDIWYRNPIEAIKSGGFSTIEPDKKTCCNIRTMVERAERFFLEVGFVIDTEITFEPENGDIADYKAMIESGKGQYGGYTPTVCSGDGDFMTEDTLWDFKVSKNAPNSTQTLQLFMYWIMGQHSGRDEFKNIDNIGIFNPRLNRSYVLNIAQISKVSLREVEEQVIGYNYDL